MKQASLKGSKLQLLATAALLLALVGCGGGGTELPQDSVGQLLPESNIGSQPSEDPGTLTPLIEPMAISETTAATGVQIVFASEASQNNIGGEYIEAQWVLMQTCLQVTAQSPTVHVAADTVTPLSDSDDVLRFIDGSILATATVTPTDATIQVVEADFDGSLGSKGNYLRSIFGRYLWFSASLPERDYPYHCANQ